MAIDLKAEKIEINRLYDVLIKEAKRSKKSLDQEKIKKAFNVAVEAHKPMRRKSGEPYIYHPIAVAQIVAEEIGLGTTSIVSALLHDTVEDTYVTLENIEEMFGEKVKVIIDGLTKIDGAVDHKDPNYSIQGENFKKIMLTLAEDARVILVKLADRLHNMRTMESMPRHNQVKTSYETFFLYAPLAHRLGLNAIKTELEDLAYKYTEPKHYEEIIQSLKDSKEKLEKYISKFSAPIISALDSSGVKYTIKSRPKGVYSIAQKMKNKNVPFDEVYDIFAIRIILDAEPENEKSGCWQIYSMVTDLYQSNPQRLRDWVSSPKANGYEALHTTVMGPDGKWVEVQIRTKRMNEIAEKGLAAHWKYKEKDSTEGKLDLWISKIRTSLENAKDDTIDFIDDLKMNLFNEEIFIFTPGGDVKSMPKGAIALDFAYEVHSYLGDHCIGAKVNTKLVPLSYCLQNGEQVEIIHSIKQSPKDLWLEIVKTTKSKHHIKSAIKKNNKVDTKKGEVLYHKIIHQLKLTDDELFLQELVKYYRCTNEQELFYKISLRKIDRHSINKYITERKSFVKALENHTPADELAKKYAKDVLILKNNNHDTEYKLSKCCNPIPGDEVFGFINNDAGIQIHKTNCSKAMHLQANFAFRTIKTKWDTEETAQHLTGISFTGTDDMGLLGNIIAIISQEEKINIKSVSFDSESGIFQGKIMLFIQNTNTLDVLIEKLIQIEDVQNIKRIHTT